MKRLLTLGSAALLLALLLAVAASSTLRGYLRYGPPLAAGIGAKLLCSAEYVIGNSRQQAWADVIQYSPLLEWLDVDYVESSQSVRTSFLGLVDRSATFTEGLGCSLDYPDTVPGLAPPPPMSIRAEVDWPGGDRVQALDAGIQSLLEEMVTADNASGLNTRALLVVADGRIVGEAYGQGADADTRLLGWSMAKSFTALLLGNLEYRGLLDLDEAPGFPEWAADDRRDIAITDLLTMTDGLGFSELYQPGDDATNMLFMAPSAAEFVLEKPAAHPPGTHFNYSSGTANLLARLHQDTLGDAQAAYLDIQTSLLVPMGMASTTVEVDAGGTFVGSSYLYATARDWARMGLLMLNGGEINGQRLLSTSWVEKATRPNDSDNEKAYGYQWWLNRGDAQLRFQDLPEEAFFANGNRQQVVMVFPSEDVVIVRLGWTSGRYPINTNFSGILTSLNEGA